MDAADSLHPVYYFRRSIRGHCAPPSGVSLPPLYDGAAANSPPGSEERDGTTTCATANNNNARGDAAGDDAFQSVASIDTIMKQKLSWWALMGLMYSNSIGGAYGLEDSIGSGGALLTIVFVLALPLIWGLPIALVVAELATAIPTNAGFLMWINVSFHKVVYGTMVILTLLLVFIDNALYPALFSDYICTWMTCTDLDIKLLRAGVLVLSCILNLIGIETVGISLVGATVITLAPFTLMLIWHLIATDGYLNWENLTSIPGTVNWTTFIPTVSWNLSGLEQAGSVAEEVWEPQRNILKALFPLMLLVYLTYIPPVLAGVSVSHKPENWSKWETGYWTTIAKDIGGQGLKLFTIFGGVVSAFGLTMSCVCTTSRNISGIAETGAFPQFLNNFLTRLNTRFGTPHWAIILNSIFTGIFSVSLSFGMLVKIDQAIYGIRVVMIFLAAIKLRYYYPTLPRPFRVPLRNDYFVLALTPAIIYCVGLTVISMLEDVQTLILCLSTIGGSVVISFVYCKFLKPDGFDGKIVASLSGGGFAP